MTMPCCMGMISQYFLVLHSILWNCFSAGKFLSISLAYSSYTSEDFIASCLGRF